ncbi:MAG: 3-deoxy-manno-octulosonate cytidylyltransferase [Candidatus Omnitrophica bacterium]|nr:3-deoxy-manno-octulosonate cytidylyltransferase [Candidatus Omnitrophota bacterium]
MKTIGVIPARFASTRFPAKVLAHICGKPMIEHVYAKAKACQQLDDVLIACDHPDIFQVVQGFGGKVVMTDPNHPSGSDRIAEAVKDLDVDVIVNIQGDEPFIDPKTVDSLAVLLKNDPACMMGTVIKEISQEADFLNPNVVKCVVDALGYALYFSRSPIPYNRNAKKPEGLKQYKHLGLYAYRKSFLLQYKDWPKSILEMTEQLEQLRVLEKGYRIKTVVTTAESIAVDTPEDLKKAEEWFAQSR